MHQSGSSFPVQMYLPGRFLGGELRARARGANVEAQYGSFGGHFGLPFDHSWYVGREKGSRTLWRDRLKLFVFHSAVLVLVFVVYNRRRESHIKYPGPDDDVRENIINYDDEGGGEDDMTAFDITPLQIPIGGPIPEMGGKLPPCKIPCESFLFFFPFYSRSISDGIFHPMSF